MNVSKEIVVLQKDISQGKFFSRLVFFYIWMIILAHIIQVLVNLDEIVEGEGSMCGERSTFEYEYFIPFSLSPFMIFFFHLLYILLAWTTMITTPVHERILLNEHGISYSFSPYHRKYEKNIEISFYEIEKISVLHLGGEIPPTFKNQIYFKIIYQDGKILMPRFRYKRDEIKTFLDALFRALFDERNLVDIEVIDKVGLFERHD